MPALLTRMAMLPTFLLTSSIRRALGGVGDVQHHALAAEFGQVGGDGFGAGVGGGGADHFRALARQFECDGLADAARCAGNEGDLVLQVHANPWR
jgi:hypothetical protein